MPIVTSFVSKPVLEMTRIGLAPCSVMVNWPRSLLVVKREVPFCWTVASGTGSPLLLKTVPEMVFDWANAEQTDSSKTIQAYSFDNDLLMMHIDFGDRIGFQEKTGDS